MYQVTNLNSNTTAEYSRLDEAVCAANILNGYTFIVERFGGTVMALLNGCVI